MHIHPFEPKIRVKSSENAFLGISFSIKSQRPYAACKDIIDWARLCSENRTGWKVRRILWPSVYDEHRAPKNQRKIFQKSFGISVSPATDRVATARAAYM